MYCCEVSDPDATDIIQNFKLIPLTFTSFFLTIKPNAVAYFKIASP